MATRALKIDPESELARALRTASTRGEHLVLLAGPDSYEIDIGAMTAAGGNDKPTPERAAEVRAAIDAASGAWKDFDAEAFKEYLRSRRRTANRPSVRF